MADRQKLCVVVMGQNCERFIKMCLESIKDVDSIVFCDGGSTDDTIDIIIHFDIDYYVDKDDPKYINQDNSKEGLEIITNKYNQEDKEMNGKQRNFYLEYVKRTYPNWWCLCLDADEIVDDNGIEQIKKDIQTMKDGMYSVRMEHLIGDLQHVDATKEVHYVGNRLFKVHPNLFYPEVEHPVLQFKDFTDSCGYVNGLYSNTIVWHLAYVLQEMLMFKERYNKNLKHSNIHDKQFLDWWYSSHLFGVYPKKEIKIEELPRVLLEFLGFEKDMFYFMNRGLEVKHFVMVKQWIDYIKPKSIIEFGAGKAPFGYAIKSYGINYDGVELSKFAVDNAFVPIIQGDIQNTTLEDEYDLVLAIDILEHLTDRELDNAMTNLIAHGNNFIFSVPVIGDENLLKDRTHKQFKTREEWTKLWESYGIKITIPPEGWLFRDQLFIGEKK